MVLAFASSSKALLNAFTTRSVLLSALGGLICLFLYRLVQCCLGKRQFCCRFWPCILDKFKCVSGRLCSLKSTPGASTSSEKWWDKSASSASKVSKGLKNRVKSPKTNTSFDFKNEASETIVNQESTTDESDLLTLAHFKKGSKTSTFEKNLKEISLSSQQLPKDSPSAKEPVKATQKQSSDSESQVSAKVSASTESSKSSKNTDSTKKSNSNSKKSAASALEGEVTSTSSKPTVTSSEDDWNVVSKKGDLQSDSAAKSKVVKLEDECAHFKQSNAYLSQLTDQLKAKIEALEAEKKSAIEPIKAKLEVAETESASLKRTVSSLKEIINQNKDALSKASSFSAENSLLKEKIAEKDVAIETLQEKISAIALLNESAKLEHEKQLTTLSNSYQLLSAECETAKALALTTQSEVESSKYIAKQLETRVEQLETEKQALSAKVADLETAAASSTTPPPPPSNAEELQNLENSLVALKTERNELKEMIDGLVQQLDQCKKDLNANLGKMAEIAFQKDGLITQNFEVQKELIQLKESLEKERVHFKEEKEQDQKLIDGFKAKLKEKTAELQKLQR